MTESQLRNILGESEWNYHFGKDHNMEPYYSDNKYNMAGRDTGHFGSGTYFSTYNCPNFEKNVNDTTDKSNPKFIKIRDGLYRVDFDLYKNLYRVTSKYHGDLLFSMLQCLNNMYNRISYSGEFNQKNANYNNADLYQKIKANADALGLDCPSYYELTRMCQNHKGIQSFSTLFMEYNGYNGVNVSGIGFYDNTLHGSVIYDLSKVSSDIKPVKAPKNYWNTSSSYHETYAFDQFKDYEMVALNGKTTQWISEIKDMPEKRAVRILKNYTDSGHALNAGEIKYFLNEKLRKYYLKMLFVKKPKDFWGEDICERLFGTNGFDELLVENGAYYWVNYEGRRSTGLIKFLDDFAFNVDFGNGSDEEKRKKKESFLNKMKGFMTRDLNDMEKRYIDSVYFTNQCDF